MGYTVVSGKYESDGSENIKYVDTFQTFDEALVAFDRYGAPYPFARVEITVGDEVIEITDPHQLRVCMVRDASTGRFNPV